MNNQTAQALPIGAVERDTHIGRDTLRVWERRYGFPRPLRTGHGVRLYPPEQVQRLILIRRLMDLGFRPGSVVPLAEEELQRLAAQHAAAPVTGQPAAVQAKLLQAVVEHDTAALHERLEQELARNGLRQLVLHTIAPLVRLVGEQWAAGRVEVFEEHFLTRQLTYFLDAAMARQGRPPGEAPVMLATLPKEPHGLGLLMVEALLTEQHLPSINLGTAVPVNQLVRAVEQYRPQALALSFSAFYPRRALRGDLEELVDSLAEPVEVWVGGAGVASMRKAIQGVRVIKDLEQI